MTNKFIVLLRAVNVSGKNLIKMAELKQVLSANGYLRVTTYIQSGNIILSSIKNSSEIKQQIKQLLFDYFNLEIEVFILEKDDLIHAFNECPFDNKIEPNKVFITFLSQRPDPLKLEELARIDHGHEHYQLIDKVLYYYLPDGMAKSKLNNNYFEKKLNVIATGRNLNTVQKLIHLAE